MRDTPTDYLWSFVIGGLLCAAAQGIFELLLLAGVDYSLSITLMLAIAAFLSGIFTVLEQYQKLEGLGGFGAMLPFTGFSAAIVEFSAAALDEGKSAWRACYLGLRSGFIIFGVGLPFALLVALLQSML